MPNKINFKEEDKMIINHNISALNTYRQLSANNSSTAKALEKLSSGLRINRAGDDAAGLAISEKMRAQIRGLEMATKNAQDGISLIQTAEGALNEVHSILQRMRELAVQSANDTNNDVDRSELQKEVNQLIDEIDRISKNTEFNTKALLDGSFKGKFHIGANSGQFMEIKIGNIGSSEIGEATGKGYEADSGVSLASADFSSTAETIKVTVDGTEHTITLNEDYGDTDGVLAAVQAQLAGSGVTAAFNEAKDKIVLSSSVAFAVGSTAAAEADITTGAKISTLKVENGTTGGILTQEAADAAITAINNAIEQVSTERSKLGAYQNRLEHTINNLGTSAENLSAAESRIRDVDMAKEMMEFTKNSILNQAATAMLAQANQLPQGVLQLLR